MLWNIWHDVSVMTSPQDFTKFLSSATLTSVCLWYLLFLVSHPSKYLEGSLLLNFNNLAGTSAISMTQKLAQGCKYEAPSEDHTHYSVASDLQN